MLTPTFVLALAPVSPLAAPQHPPSVTLPAGPGLKDVAVEGVVGVFGRSLEGIGDFNGDGLEDFAVGEPEFGLVALGQGACFVLFGSTSWALESQFDVGTLDGVRGFRVLGHEVGDRLGDRLARAGDVNGDGYDDLAIVAPFAHYMPLDRRGSVYVLFGGPQVGAGGTIAAGSIGGASGFRVVLPANSFDEFVMGLGDTDGDGFGELAISLPSAPIPLPTFAMGATETTHVAAGDVNADGFEDFAVSHPVALEVRVFTSSGGSFPSQTIPVAVYAYDLELVDLNGDSLPEIVAIGAGLGPAGGLVVVVPNLGGAFGAPATFSVPDLSTSTAIGDLDGDGDRDLAVALFDGFSNTPSEVRMLLNDGAGSLSLGTILPLAFDPTAVGLADLDGDGDPELVANSQHSNDARVFENLGNATFAAPVIAPGSSNSLYDFALADLDGDGDLDMIHGAQSLRWSRNMGGLVFPPSLPVGNSASHRSVRSDDVDADGDIDLVTCGADWSNTFRVWLNDGSGVFSSRLFQQDTTAREHALADVDGDGRLDIVLATKTTNLLDYGVAVRRALGDGVFEGAECGMVSVFRGSTSIGSGSPYILDANPPAQGFALYGRQGGEKLGAHLRALGDFDADGFSDFALSPSTDYEPGFGGTPSYVIRGKPGLGSSGTLEERVLSGPDGFVIRRTASQGSSAAVRAVGDFDGDGANDLVLGGGATAGGVGVGETLILFGSPVLGASGLELLGAPDGVTLHAVRTEQASDQLGLAAACGDFDGDGRDDLLVSAPFHDEILTNRGAVFFVPGSPRPFAPGGLVTSTLDGTNGFRMLGEATNGQLGTGVACPGDVDGNGIDDWLVSDHRWASLRGRAHLVLGQPHALPFPYCTAQTNSAGCAPAIGWSGEVPSVSGSNAFHVLASGIVNHKAGLLFYGLHGRKAQPYQGGVMCVRSPLRRTPAQFSGGSPGPVPDCSGAYDFDWSAWMASGADPALTAGTAVDAQFWSRDPLSTFHTNLSDAMEFAIWP